MSMDYDGFDSASYFNGPAARATRIRRRRLESARQKGTHTKTEWLNLLEQFRTGVGIYFCPCCFGEFGGLEADHIIPIVMGGSDHISNIQPLCASCNQSKGWRDSTDYRDRCSPIGKSIIGSLVSAWKANGRLVGGAE
jgi:5-methylcytosine-specific restriction endonuclease McrA